MTFEVRFHGRGGQGVVTAAELLSVAAFSQGRRALAFPSFGSERTGAPVVSYCRIDDRAIRSHDPVTDPHAVVVQDPTLLRLPGVLDGMATGAYLLVNSSSTPASLGLGLLVAQLEERHIVTVAASEAARRMLGRPLPNTALLGALAGLTGVVTLESLQEAIRERFSGASGELNASLAEEGFALATGGSRRHAQAG
jgi:pyruvate ferredoxin oxidoreductase gamma subunit